MKIRTKLILVGLLALGFARAAIADSLTYASSGKSLSSSWTTTTLPAGAVVHSVAVATADFMNGPSAYYGATLPATHINVTTNVWSDLLGWVRATVSVEDQPTVSWNGSWDTNPQSSHATAQVGIAGPPAGLVHEARAVSTGGTVADEKIATLTGGVYQIYHGGGVSGNGSVSGYTYISW